MRAKLILPFLILYLFCHLLSVQGHEVDIVNAGSDKNVASSQVYEVTSEGAWCWFADPRALHYENEKGTINKTYVGYIDIHGNIKAMQYDFKKKRQDEVLIRSYFQPDDHNNPTFLVLPDERIMIFYSRHTDEPCFYYRISRLPGDITTLGEEKVIKTKDNTTYPSPFILSDDPEHIYLCWRGIGWHPTIAKLSLPDQNDQVAVEWGPYQIVQSTGARPYAKYMSNGKDKIYFAYTTGHPDNENPNFLYFNYIDIHSLQLKDVKGNTLSTIADGTFKVNKTDDYARQYPSTLIDNPSARDWVWQVASDENDNPVIAMVRISSDKNHVYCSLPVEGKQGKVYEIVKFILNEVGEVVSTEAVTQDSQQNNVRPYIVPNSKNTPLRLTWMYGNYYDWIVSSRYPQGYCTGIACDFKGFPGAKKEKTVVTEKDFKFNPKKAFVLEQTVTLDADNYQGSLLQLGDLQYYLNGQTMKPEVRYNGKVYPSTNILGTSDCWKTTSRNTGGEWYTPQKYGSFKLKLEYKKGVLCVYINGLLDQKIEIQ